MKLNIEFKILFETTIHFYPIDIENGAYICGGRGADKEDTILVLPLGQKYKIWCMRRSIEGDKEGYLATLSERQYTLLLKSAAIEIW